jgi:hypothetical protein
MGAQEAIENGFADEIMNQEEGDAAQARALVKSFNLRHCKHVPENIRKPRNNAEGCDCDCRNCIADDCGSCTNRDCDDPNCADCPNQEPIGSVAGDLPKDSFDELARQRLALYERA